ncbi:hypothetical protein AVEN_155575-1 [Araneus ventricosus]|uniref:Uncharacterized protein n=1 Tax=Araneus ventricosus TaxID=182803 RepID=A0A4Y2IPM7_ARAVE|nr:hypothetical protein AVEN_155575-1 [Araneus ventricosus]
MLNVQINITQLTDLASVTLAPPATGNLPLWFLHNSLSAVMQQPPVLPGTTCHRKWAKSPPPVIERHQVSREPARIGASLLRKLRWSPR